jgi:hypothetical protein
VLFAGLALLFTSRYPRPLYDSVVGLNRCLMTDTYPAVATDGKVTSRLVSTF